MKKTFVCFYSQPNISENKPSRRFESSYLAVLASPPDSHLSFKQGKLNLKPICDVITQAFEMRFTKQKICVMSMFVQICTLSLATCLPSLNIILQSLNQFILYTSYLYQL